MTDKKDDPAKEAPRTGETAGPKKPYATLDLKATEVTPKEAGATGAGAGSSKPGAATSSASSGPAAAGAAAGRAEPQGAASAGAGSRGPAAQSPGSKPGAGQSDARSPESRATPDATTSASATTPTGARRTGGIGSVLSHLAAGLAGGAVVLVGTQMIGTGSGRDAGGTEMQRRLAALEQGAKTQAGAPELAKKLAAVEERLGRVDELGRTVAATAEAQGKLEAETKAMGEKIGATTTPEGTEARLAELEERLQSLAAMAEADPQAGRIPQLAALTGKIADLESALPNQINALRSGLTQEIESRFAPISEASEAAKSGTARLDRDVAALKTDTARLAQRMEALKADNDRFAQSLRAVQEETGALRSGLDGLKPDLDAKLQSLAKPADVAAAVAPVSAKLAALEERVQGVAKAEDERRANAERIVLALELANLKRVIDRGQPYAAELADVQRAAAGRVDLAALERNKSEGVASLADLQREFRPVAHAMVDAQSQPVDGSVMDRLLAGAKSVVRVRKVSHSADDTTVEAIAGRMEAALEDGRLGDVLAEAKALPPPSAAAARDWLAKVEARHAAGQAIAAIETQLKSSLAGAPAAGATAPPASSQVPADAAPAPDKPQK
jgi:hypothetical protein